MRMRFLAAALMLAFAGGASATPSKTKPLRFKEGYCVHRRDHARVVRFRASDGVRLLGVTMGKGTVGVALGHESSARLCNWMPFARRLAHAGYRVLPFDFRNAGSSATVWTDNAGRLDLDYHAAAAVLRERGATKIVFAGASLGATAALVAAGTSPQPVDAVAELSGPSEWPFYLDPLQVVASLHVPVLYMAAEDDHPYSEDARRFYAQTAEADKQLAILPGGEHGTRLLRGTRGRPGRATLLAFIQATTAY
jgi:pimeloyl-ACP methyl ester carboxylesterase